MIIDLVYITLIVVFIIDISGFTQAWKSTFAKYLTKGVSRSVTFSFKPFDCSLCMNFWVSLIYLLCIGSFSLLSCLEVCLLSFSTFIIRDIFLIIMELWGKLNNHIS